MYDEIRRIISGKGKVRNGANIAAAIRYLRKSEKSSALGKTNKHFKSEETERLKQYIENQSLCLTTSYSNTAAAAETFKEAMFPKTGIFTISSQMRRLSEEIP